MAKSKKPVKSSSGPPQESNTGLIVTLIFFVLLSLTLGVFTYFGYDGQAQLAENEKKAIADKNKANKALDEETTRRIALAIATGNEQPGDQQRLNALKNQNKAAFDAQVAALKEIGRWDSAVDRPAETYQDTIGKLRQERDTARNEKKQADSNLETARNQHAADVKTKTDSLAKANEDLKKAGFDAIAELKKAQDSYLAEITRIDTVSEALRTEKQNHEDDRAAADKALKQRAAVVASLDQQILKLKSLVNPPNSMEADTPKGKILRIERDAHIAYINLGSADFLKPQVTFSIWSPGTSGKEAASRERKGRLEVVRILEPHLATARVIDVKSEIRDPILQGDLLYNPSWSSSQRDHVALVGIFDIDGDGLDDTAEVIRNLERQGVIVDAYLDLRDRTVKGPGITERTSYLVVGEKPQLPESLARQRAQLGDNPKVQAYEQISAGIAQMEEKATQKGVEKVTYLNYLKVLGYPLPKLTKPLDLQASSYLQHSATAPPPPAETPKEGDGKPKEEKPK